jgi:hypothetical protein
VALWSQSRNLVAEQALPLWPQQGFDGAALVHGLVALGDLVEGKGEVEDLAGADPSVPDQVDELGQEPAHPGRLQACTAVR